MSKHTDSVLQAGIGVDHPDTRSWIFQPDKLHILQVNSSSFLAVRPFVHCVAFRITKNNVQVVRVILISRQGNCEFWEMFVNRNWSRNQSSALSSLVHHVNLLLLNGMSDILQDGADVTLLQVKHLSEWCSRNLLVCSESRMSSVSTVSRHDKDNRTLFLLNCVQYFIFQVVIFGSGVSEDINERRRQRDLESLQNTWKTEVCPSQEFWFLILGGWLRNTNAADAVVKRANIMIASKGFTTCFCSFPPRSTFLHTRQTNFVPLLLLQGFHLKFRKSEKSLH